MEVLQTTARMQYEARKYGKRRDLHQAVNRSQDWDGEYNFSSFGVKY